MAIALPVAGDRNLQQQQQQQEQQQHSGKAQAAAGTWQVMSLVLPQLGCRFGVCSRTCDSSSTVVGRRQGRGVLRLGLCSRPGSTQVGLRARQERGAGGLVRFHPTRVAGSFWLLAATCTVLPA
jgi:hypothetical protein